MKFIKPGDIIIFILILLLSLFLCRFLFNYQTGTVKIQANGTLYQYPLSKDAEYKVHGLTGITTVQVQNNRVRITDSPCPNKTCVKQNWGNTIICLPNNVIVTVENREDLDAVSE